VRIKFFFIVGVQKPRQLKGLRALFLRSVRSIRGKLAILIAASVGTAVVLAFVVGSYRELSRFAEAKHAESQATAEVLAASVAEAVAKGDRGTALRALHAIGRLPDVKFAEIRDRAGDLFAEAGAGVALTRGGAEHDGPPSFWRMLTRGSMFVTADIVRGGREVGSLGLLIDTSALLARLQQALAAAALSAVAAILIGLLVAARLQRSITGPLGDLAGTMNRVRETGDFAQRAERRSDDETGQLVDAFNDMLGQIRRRDVALEEHRAGLERTVVERTRDLAEARDAAEAANRAKSDFLATMSHEIRTPMNGMLVMAELLAGTDLPARQQRYAETIVRSGQTLLTIINDILDLSKIEAGKLELEQGRVALSTVVEDVLGLFWERASSKNLDLAALIAPDVPAVIEADPVRLSQILSNLVNNALKFTERGSVLVSVAARVEPGAERAELTFCIDDTGIGIAGDKVGTIFEAFSQADQSTTRRYGGTGLGLSICQRLVAAMGGRIWVESEPGRGSAFAFTISARILERAKPRTPMMGRGAMVAIDGHATATVLEDALRVAGYRVATAADDVRPAIVFATPERIEAHQGGLGGPARPAAICLAGVGDSRADRLVAAGSVDALLQLPISTGRVQEALAAFEAGALASLSAERRDRHADPTAALPDVAGLNVLVADDSPVNREVVSEALGRLRAHTRTVEDGAQAVEAFKTGRFDLVLMDCSMPEMDGFAATRAIRRLEEERGVARTPVIALTAQVAGAAADSWCDAGMDDYLTKPFTMRSLADCLGRWRPKWSRRGKPAGDAPADASPRSAEPETAEPLDAAVLASLRTIAGGNGAMLARIFGLFQVHAPARLAALREALAAGEMERAASEAHALKSPSLNIGALRLGALCQGIEARARACDATLKPDAELAPLEAELAAVVAAIQREQPDDMAMSRAS
jgi:two-component system sensor histidine kinase BarA